MKTKRYLIAFLACASVVAIIVLIFPATLPSRWSQERDSEENESSLLGGFNLDRHSGRARSKSARPSTQLSPQEIARQMANSPLSATGVNSYAKEHYNLNDDQLQAISAALKEARLNIAQTIVGNMEQFADSPHAARTIAYKPNQEIAKQFARDLHIKLTNIVSTEFADSGIQVLYHDFRFLGGGQRVVRIEVNPGDNKEEVTVKSVRIKTMNEDLEPASVWEGSYETFKNAYWIELDL